MKGPKYHITEDTANLEALPSGPVTPESLYMIAERATTDINTYADTAYTLPRQTVDAVNTVTNLSPEHMERLKEETGFSETLRAFSGKLDAIKRGARRAVEQFLIATTLVGSSPTPVQGFATEANSRARIEAVDATHKTTPTQKVPLQIREATPENKITSQGESEQHYIETTGDSGVYQEKVTSLRRSANDSPREQSLVVLQKKDGGYVFREARLSSAGGGFSVAGTKEEIRESTHVEQIHTHPNGLTVELNNPDGKSHFVSYAQYMPPSMPDIWGSFDFVNSTSVRPEHFSFRVIDPHGDWVYMINVHHAFFNNLKKAREKFFAESERQHVLLTEEEQHAIEKSGLTVDIIRHMDSHEKYDNPLIKTAQEKIIAQGSIEKKVASQLVPKEMKLLETIQNLSVEITNFDNDGLVYNYSPGEKTRHEKEQRDRITKLCALYEQVGVTMTYTPRGVEK